MRSFRLSLVGALFGVLLSLAQPVCAREVPAFAGAVTDTANILSPAAKAQIESEIAALEKSDSTQVAVLTVESLEGEPIEEFGIKVAESWKIGQKGKDNGAIIILSKQDRNARIEVGRGLEGNLTDLLSGRILKTAGPDLTANNYDKGIHRIVQDVAKVVKGEYTVSKEDVSLFTTLQESKLHQGGLAALLIIGLVIAYKGWIPAVLFGAASGAASGFFLLGSVAAGIGAIVGAVAGIILWVAVITEMVEVLLRLLLSVLTRGGGSSSSGGSGGGGSFGGGGSSSKH